MKDRPDLESLPQLKREAHRIFAQYDPEPVNAIYQHCLIKEMMTQDFGTEEIIVEEAQDSGDRST